MKVVLTRRALADLDTLADWIGNDNPSRSAPQTPKRIASNAIAR
jgi:plasmid stabilization system protein ParE